ncbi:hypothetical protein [Chryseolinea sp. H1M3-3]|uniref:hypothetical protein n=1 Tax=Chryseolinea sp. H1M3-3 TaxID=3034144 RepID=UPI0023ED7314|nr:hypothetical protein [Chryseolinea sp. H1M3-3]
MNRRTFVRTTFQTTSLVAAASALSGMIADTPTVRLGGPLFERTDDPDSWIAAVKRLGYRAAYCPLKLDAAADVVQAYASAARKADIVIAEVGAWSNPLSADAEMAQQAFKRCVDSLKLAELSAQTVASILVDRKTQSIGQALTKTTYLKQHLVRS